MNGESGEQASALAVCMDAAAQDVSLFDERAGERTKKLVQADRIADMQRVHPFALERLTELDEGCVEYAFRKPWRDGTRAVVLTADDLLARLRAMGKSAQPRFHMIRYVCVLASNAALRAEVVPGHAKEDERIILDERRRRGEPVSEMEVRGPPRGRREPLCSLCSRFGEGDRATLRDFARWKRPAAWG